MATFTKTEAGTIKVTIRKAGYPTITKTLPNMRLARIYGDREEAKIAEDRALGRSPLTMCFPELVTEYLDHYKGRDWKSRASHLRVWVQILGDKPVNAIARGDIEGGLREIRKRPVHRGTPGGVRVEKNKRITGSTVNRYLSALSGALRYAVKVYGLKTNPATGIPQEKETKGGMPAWSDKQVSKLREACRKSEWSRLHLFVDLLYSTGATVGEVLTLRWCDVDFKSRQVSLCASKLRKKRILHLPSSVTEEMQRFRGSGAEFLFPGKGGSYQREFCKRQAWKRATRKAKVEGFQLNDFRALFAQRVATNGACLSDISTAMGLDVKSLKRYGLKSTSSLRDVIDRVFQDILI